MENTKKLSITHRSCIIKGPDLLKCLFFIEIDFSFLPVWGSAMDIRSTPELNSIHFSNVTRLTQFTNGKEVKSYAYRSYDNCFSSGTTYIFSLTTTIQAIRLIHASR